MGGFTLDSVSRLQIFWMLNTNTYLRTQRKALIAFSEDARVTM